MVRSVLGSDLVEKVSFFGSSLDVLDATEKVEIKRAYILAVLAGKEPQPNFLDPYEALGSMSASTFGYACEWCGKVPIDTWLTPKPLPQDLFMVTSENYKAFLEANGCLKYSQLAGDFVNDILPSSFVMIGVDHSQTGGVLRKLSEYYGAERISLVLLDAHFDTFDFELVDAVRRQLTGRGKDYQSPLYENNFYSCGNFLKFLLQENVILPENLFVIGVADYPSQKLQRNQSPDVKRYVQEYMGIVEEGVNVIPKTEVESPENKLPEFLCIRTPYVYVSIDMDVGAFSSVYGVRFLNTVGMREDCIYKTAKAIKDVIDGKNLRCVGLDLMELDVHFAGVYRCRKVVDRSYEVACNIIQLLLFGVEGKRMTDYQFAMTTNASKRLHDSGLFSEDG
jgi:arginase family enzyme